MVTTSVRKIAGAFSRNWRKGMKYAEKKPKYQTDGITA
jgi:hypothetical protein